MRNCGKFVSANVISIVSWNQGGNFGGNVVPNSGLWFQKWTTDQQRVGFLREMFNSPESPPEFWQVSGRLAFCKFLAK
jgi:hypothetical protein